MTKYNVICMSFDGEYQRERFDADSVDDAWNYADDLGSKWYFYPFYFVTTESCKTVKGAVYPLTCFVGKRVNTVSKIFEKLSAMPEAQNLDVESFAYYVSDGYI